MQDMSISITNATRTSIKATVTAPAGVKVNRRAIRTVIMQLAAHAMGKGVEDLTARPAIPGAARGGMGYDPEMKLGWVQEGELSADGQVKVLRYEARPVSGFEWAERLHREGGTTPAQGGGVNYYLPGEYPKPTTTVVTVRQRKAPASQVKPASPATRERMALPRLR